MKAETKTYIITSSVAILLIIAGMWGYNMGGRANEILGAISFVTGFIIMFAVYGLKWLDQWLH